MKTLKLFFNDGEKSFMNECKAKKISTRIVKKGNGFKHCMGPYQYKWIENDDQNDIFEVYMKRLAEYSVIQVLFHNTVDRALFIKEFQRRYECSRFNVATLKYYYGMDKIYDVLIYS